MGLLPIVLFIAFGVFSLGLYQWARSGESLWRIFTLHRRLNDGKKHGWEEQEKAEAEIHRLERSADGLLRSSMRTIGFVMLLVWVVAGATFILDAFGVNWARNVTSRASTYWKAILPAGFEQHTSRNDILQGMSSHMK